MAGAEAVLKGGRVYWYNYRWVLMVAYLHDVCPTAFADKLKSYLTITLLVVPVSSLTGINFNNCKITYCMVYVYVQKRKLLNGNHYRLTRHDSQHLTITNSRSINLTNLIKKRKSPNRIIITFFHALYRM